MSGPPELQRRSSSFWVTIPVALGVVAGTLIALLPLAISNPNVGLLQHTICRTGTRIGNVTEWRPDAIVEAPFTGSESGTLIEWGNTSIAHIRVVEHPHAEDGNVTAWEVNPVNWTLFAERNVTLLGPGAESRCTDSVLGILSPPSLAGGTVYSPIATSLERDAPLPHYLNSSALCQLVLNATPRCAGSVTFDVGFAYATGEIDTCGSPSPSHLSVKSHSLPVGVPFNITGRAGTARASLENGPAGSIDVWYNYTFPANGGVWLYDDLSITSKLGAGLAFSYSSCL